MAKGGHYWMAIKKRDWRQNDLAAKKGQKYAIEVEDIDYEKLQKDAEMKYKDYLIDIK
jgi:hypothetical protein